MKEKQWHILHCKAQEKGEEDQFSSNKSLRMLKVKKSLEIYLDKHMFLH